MERGEESLTFLRRSPRRWKSRSDRMESSSLSGESSGQPVLSVPAASSRTTFYYLLVLSSRGGLPANVSLSEIFRWETSRYTSLRIWTPPLVQHFSLDFYYHFELMSYNRHILLLRIFTLILLLLPWLINVNTREDIKRERYATFFPRFYFPRLFLTRIVTILHFIIIYIFTLVLLL